MTSMGECRAEMIARKRRLLGVLGACAAAVSVVESVLRRMPFRSAMHRAHSQTGRNSGPCGRKH